MDRSQLRQQQALALQPDASDAAVKKAYYKKALKCHPDKHPGDAEKKAQFQQISAAYAVLSDPEARRRYDATGQADEAPQQDPAVFFVGGGVVLLPRRVGELFLEDADRPRSSVGESCSKDARPRP